MERLSRVLLLKIAASDYRGEFAHAIAAADYGCHTQSSSLVAAQLAEICKRNDNG